MSSFTEFLRSRQDEAQAESASLEARKTEWLAALRELYATIRAWLAEPLSLNLSTIREEPIELSEYKLGSYETTKLVLKTGQDTVQIEPAGAFIIGARGRVDVKTTGASLKLILNDENEWGILEASRTSAKQLDEKTFLRALQNLLS